MTTVILVSVSIHEKTKHKACPEYVQIQNYLVFKKKIKKK